MPHSVTERLTLDDLTRRLRAVERRVFLVPERLIRRLVRARMPVGSFGLIVPHRKGLIASESELSETGVLDDLGPHAFLERGQPRPFFLLVQPQSRELARRPASKILRDYWRLLFHARVHEALDRLAASGELSSAEIQSRIHRIGEVEFDEIRLVLARERLLLPPQTNLSTYIEFAAVFLELRAFAPDLLGDYFPGLDDAERVASMLADHLDPAALLEQTRPEGFSEPSFVPSLSTEEIDDSSLSSPVEEAAEPFSSVRYRAQMTRAERVEALGNLVRASILRTRASWSGSRAQAGQARSQARDALDRLSARLRDALGFDDALHRHWRSALRSLREPAAIGKWPAAARLLYDLQAVCVDHEREIYKIDLIEWLLSFGRRTLKRLLPNQREVAECKHLRLAIRHLGRVAISDADRNRLSSLLHHALDGAEERLRDRFRPLIRRALERGDLVPSNPPERVAYNKMTEELLDLVVERGYLTAGDLRDAISRNDLKLPDLSPSELIQGDRLLRVDHRLSVSLEGVYRRAEIYLRALQKSSSIAFGTWLGRVITLFLIIPFGGAFVTLEGLTHLVEPVHAYLSGSHEQTRRLTDLALSTTTLGAWRVGPPEHEWHHALAEHLEHPIHLVSAPSVLILGLLVLLLVHVPPARSWAWRTARTLGILLKRVLFDFPAWLLTRPAIELILTSRPARLLWHWFFAPSLAAFAVGSLTWVLEHHHDFAYLVGALTFLAVLAVINSRLGRNLEEEIFEQASRSWSRLHADLIPGLYRAVMSFFDRMLETIDRVLYTVDEWLRFRSGEGQGTLAVKAVLGALWFVVTYLTRLVVNLLVEPQVNPIKHFPVVTVAHKVTLPFMIEFLRFLLGPPFYVEPMIANPVVFTMQMLLPGVFGFLIWELKENWKLYEANRPSSLRPVPIGHHGETMGRLLRPGFHSGTIPKLFDHLRRDGRKALQSGRKRKVHKDREALRLAEHAVRHFIDRELLALLRQSPTLRDLRVSLTRVVLATNRVRVELAASPGSQSPCVILFEEQSGWIVATIDQSGWLDDLDRPTRLTFSSALSGLYKKASVQVVREQVRLALEPSSASYDINDNGLVAWYPQLPGSVARLDLASTPSLPVQPADSLPTALHPRIVSDRLAFARASIPWTEWVNLWLLDESGQPPVSLLETGEILPSPSPEPASSNPLD